MMEERSIVGPRDGPRPREVLVSSMEVEELFGGPSAGSGYVSSGVGDEPFSDDEE